MASKSRSSQRAVVSPVTPERAARLYQLLKLIGGKPRSRDVLVDHIGLGVRGFYRDLEALRSADIEVILKDGRYILDGKLGEAISRLPFPDPGLTLGEASQLARGTSKTHKKLKKLLATIMKGA